jgi:hypothetical protein
MSSQALLSRSLPVCTPSPKPPQAFCVARQESTARSGCKIGSSSKKYSSQKW